MYDSNRANTTPRQCVEQRAILQPPDPPVSGSKRADLPGDDRPHYSGVELRKTTAKHRIEDEPRGASLMTA